MDAALAWTTRNLESGTVANAMPPMNRPPRRGAAPATASRQDDHRQATDITGWASRMIDVTMAGSRGNDSEMKR